MPGQRAPRWSDKEIIELARFVNDNRSNLFGKAGHCSDKVEARKRRYWEKASNFLATECGGRRPWNDTRKKWADLKIRAHDYEGLKEQTGGGPEPKIKPALETVLEAIERQSRHGVVGRNKELGCSQSSNGSQNSTGSSDVHEANDDQAVAALECMGTDRQTPPLPVESDQTSTTVTEPQPKKKKIQNINKPSTSTAESDHEVDLSESATPHAATKPQEKRKKNMKKDKRNKSSTANEESVIEVDPAESTADPNKMNDLQIRRELLTLERQKVKLMKESKAVQEKQVEAFEEMVKVLKSFTKSDE